MYRVYIKSCLLTNMYLSVSNSDISSIESRTDVVLRAFQRQDSQYWDIRDIPEREDIPQTPAKSLHPRINNYYALNAYKHTNQPWACDVYNYYPELEDAYHINKEAYLYFIPTNTANCYRIQQSYHLDYYLTANADGSVIWSTYTDGNSQIWEFGTTLIPGCDTAAPLTAADVEAVVAAGYQFVGRYLDFRLGAHNDLTVAEATRISNAGLNILSFWQPEGNEEIAELNYNVGVTQATNAIAAATAIAQTLNTYIFFCVESKIPPDFTAVDLNTYLLPYLQGIDSIFSNSTTNVRNYKWGFYSEAFACRKVKEWYPSCHIIMNADSNAMTSVHRFENWDIYQGKTIALQTSAGTINVDDDEAMPTTFNFWHY